MKRLGGILLIVGMANFVAFVVMAMILGGDAWNGNVEDGHYYLAAHGRRTEVSYAVWLYSYIHVASVFVTHPLGGVGGLIWVLLREHEQKMSQ